MLHADFYQIDYYDRYNLEDVHIKNCQLLVDRRQMIDKLVKDGIIAEIGVDKGDFSQDILLISKPRILHLIDYWKGDDGLKIKERVEERFEQEILNSKVIINHGCSLEVLQSLPDKYLDWVYLDTCHSFDQTYKELELIMHKVKENGMICGHDFSMGNWKHLLRYGVIEAVSKFCLKHHWQLAYISLESNLFWSFALKKIP